MVLVTLIIVLVVMGIAAFVYWRKRNQISVQNSHNDHTEKQAVASRSKSSCYQTAYKLLPNAILILSSENQILYMNPSAERMLSCKLRSMMGRHYKDAFSLLHIKTRRQLHGIIDTDNSDNSHSNEYLSNECLLQTNLNQVFPISLEKISLMNMVSYDGESQKLIIMKNITETKAMQSKLSDLEKYDTLTRLLNQKSFDVEVKHLIDNIHKHNSSHILVYFSIDQFQIINDTLSYSAGDSLIVEMADLINSHITKNLDVVGRVSGSEFAVVFRERRLASAVKEVESILAEVRDTNFTSRGKSYPVTLSAGFVIVDIESTSSTRAISEANIACNLARKSGGNHVCAYKPDNAEIQKLEGNLEWIIIIKEAIQKNRFRMYAQPIHPLNSEEYSKPFYHYELLIRLSDDKGHPIAPNEFLSAAEYYSMMPTIDRWVVRNVLEQLGSVPYQSPLPIFAINLSGQSLNDPRFLDYVVEEVKSSNVDPRMLCFEITEQVAVEDLTLVNKFISSLKTLGSSFSLDDFGTGVSSYSYLRSLDVDYLKIDGSFVKNIASDEVAMAMVQSINQVGQTMNLKVIAEYVENEKILDLLRDMGVDYGQGYQIMRPAPLVDILKQHLISEK